MNRAKAIAEAMEMQPARGWTEALSKAHKIPGEPEYQRRCSYCGDVVEEGQQCCHEIHNEMEAECPMCGDEIEWQHSVTSCGLEASVPKCTHCEWEGDPQ
jgi:hypothetical protein